VPIYEYVCGGCERRFEKLVRRFDEAVACPACASAAVEKQLSVFAVAAAGPARDAAAPCGVPAAGCGAGASGGGGCSLS
jgi:putative FmdB family regulatory protein